MFQNSCELSVLIGGRKLREYVHEGQTFIEGREGSAFEIEFANNTNSNVEVILSVDGVSIVDGKQAGENSTGYMIRAFSSARIPGWKVTNGDAAAFRFSGKKNGSYAAQTTGSEQNNGVIGAMVFRERPRIAKPIRYRDREPDAAWLDNNEKIRGMRSYGDTKGIMRGATLGVSASAAPSNLGTEFGERINFHTTTVDFERGLLLGTMVLYYDNATGLTRRGIVVNPPRIVEAPNAFPASPTFCPPPSGWRG